MSVMVDSTGAVEVSGLPVQALCDVLEAAGIRVLVEAAHPQSPHTWAGLSCREIEILQCIGAGMTNQDLADHAYLSINTVKTYIRNAYRKIGVTSRAQAVRWAMDHRIGDPPVRPQRSSCAADGDAL